MMNSAMKQIIKDSEIKVVVFRILYNESQKLKFEGGHQEHYGIMQKDL